jgi:hypothetical protein
MTTNADPAAPAEPGAQLETRPFSRLSLAHLDEIAARHRREMFEALRTMAEDMGLEMGRGRAVGAGPSGTPLRAREP